MPLKLLYLADFYVFLHAVKVVSLPAAIANQLN